MDERHLIFRFVSFLELYSIYPIEFGSGSATSPISEERLELLVEEFVTEKRQMEEG